MLDKFLFGNKQISEMYFGNIPVVQIYFGNTLVWEKSSDIPYDDTCTATITLSQDNTAWIVTITKNGEDVTGSLSQMITWIYNGKGERVDPQYAYSDTIDLSQFPRGDYRLDLSRITSKAGGYFPGSGSISAPDHIYIGQLLAGDKNVSIEIDLTDAATDLIISSLEIFTYQQSSSTAGRIHIYHESGIEVAQIIGDSVDAKETRYSLEGYPRTVNNLNITLAKGHKYYLTYNDSNPGVYYPTYFQNENGNYKEFSSGNSNDTPLTTFGSMKAILPSGGGELTEASMQSILRLNQNEQFAWIGNNITNNGTIISQNHTATKQTTAANAPILNDADIWRTAKDTIFIWHNKSNTQVIQRIYKKTAEAVSGTIGSLNPSGTEDVYLASIFLGVKNNPAVLESDSKYWFNNKIGSLFKLKSQYTVDFDSTTPATSLPSNPQDNHLYYLNVNGLPNNPPSVYCYNNGTYTFINKWGNTDISTYIDITDSSNLAENISFASQVQDGSVFTREQNLANAETKINRKYYLKINGNEV